MISNKSINISNDFAMRVFFFLMAIITSSVIGVFSQTSTPKKICHYAILMKIIR